MCKIKFFPKDNFSLMIFEILKKIQASVTIPAKASQSLEDPTRIWNSGTPISLLKKGFDGYAAPTMTPTLMARLGWCLIHQARSLLVAEAAAVAAAPTTIAPACLELLPFSVSCVALEVAQREESPSRCARPCGNLCCRC